MTYLRPIVAIVLGYLVLREPITVAMLGGCGLVLIGVALAQRRPTATLAESEPAS